MGITSVDEKIAARTGSKNRLWQRTYTRVFIVQTDDRNIGCATIWADSRVPQIGNYYKTDAEYDYGSFVETVDPAQSTEDGLQWDVSVKYSPYDPNEFPEDPTQWKPVITYGSQKYERSLTEDQDGNPIINTAGQPFADPVTIDDTRSLITITRNELVNGFDRTLAAQYKDTINSSGWNGFDDYTVKCDDITTGEPQYDSVKQVWYYQVTYVFSVNTRETWRLSVLSQGFAELVGSELKPIQDKGQPISEAALLDSSGARTTDPYFLTFKGYPEVDFGTFNIDFSLCLGY